MNTRVAVFTAVVALISLSLPVPAATATPGGNAIVSPDVVGDVGDRGTAIAIDGLGNPVVAYYDKTNDGLKVLHCGNPTCTSGNSITTPYLGLAADKSMVLNASGHPVVAFNSGTGLRVLHCGDANCSAGNVVSLVDALATGKENSIALDSAGNPVISYYDIFNQDLMVVWCGDPQCSTGNSFTSPDSANDVGSFTSLVLDAADNPIISYYDRTNTDLKVIHCGATDCSAGNTITSPDTVGFVGEMTSIVLDAAGNPIVAYYDGLNGEVKILHCGNATCSAGNTMASPDPGFTQNGFENSIVLDAAGNPIVSYRTPATDDLRILHCGNPTCTSGNSIVDVDTAGDVGLYSSLAIGSGGTPVAAYYDETNGDLKVLACGDANCTPSFCNGEVISMDMDTNGGNGNGKAGPDVIGGTAGADVINGFGGDDFICSGGGADIVKGGAGDDSISGGPGADDIKGGGGADTIFGAGGNDIIDGQGGTDTIEGQAGNDTIDGRGAADVIGGGGGDDTIAGQNGADTINGGNGIDDLSGQTGPDTFDGGADDDDMRGGEGADTLYGGSGVDKCSGNTGPDMAEAATCETTPGVEVLF